MGRVEGRRNTVDAIDRSPILKRHGLTWPQATMNSIAQVQERYRIHGLPTTLLLGPDGKIISLGQRRKKQPSLRGRDLLKSLDQILPP